MGITGNVKNKVGVVSEDRHRVRLAAQGFQFDEDLGRGAKHARIERDLNQYDCSNEIGIKRWRLSVLETHGAFKEEEREKIEEWIKATYERPVTTETPTPRETPSASYSAPEGHEILRLLSSTRTHLDVIAVLKLMHRAGVTVDRVLKEVA